MPKDLIYSPGKQFQSHFVGETDINLGLIVSSLLKVAGITSALQAQTQQCAFRNEYYSFHDDDT